MKKSSRNSASVNFNINVPTDVIREYFDGLAKVEAAKSSVNKSLDWSSLATAFTPFLAPVVSELVAKSLGGEVKYSESAANEFCGEGCVTSSASSPEVLISFVQKDAKNETAAENSNKEPAPEPKNDASQPKPGTAKNVNDSNKPKRPSYPEGNIQFDLNSLGNHGGISEMMKMFAPMLQGLQGFTSNLEPKEGEASTQKPEDTEPVSENSLKPELEAD